ncbi:MAG: hypothetical protein OHK0046_42320 [Anaerolineae bacterium]
MATKILTFNPLDAAEREQMEAELDRYLDADWDIISSAGAPDGGYVMLVLRKITQVALLPHPNTLRQDPPENHIRHMGFRRSVR